MLTTRTQFHPQLVPSSYLFLYYVELMSERINYVSTNKCQSSNVMPKVETLKVSYFMFMNVYEKVASSSGHIETFLR